MSHSIAVYVLLKKRSTESSDVLHSRNIVEKDRISLTCCSKLLDLLLLSEEVPCWKVIKLESVSNWCC